MWVDGLLFKQLEHNISGKTYQIIKSFLKTRVASIELNGYKSPKFQIDIGVPQGSVLSPLLFIFFLNDFLSNQAQKFEFADDSSLIATGKDPSELSAIRRKTCSDIEKWFADWRMLVNGGKTELIFFNCKENDFEPSCLSGDICQVKKKQQQSLSEYSSIASSTIGIILLNLFREQSEIGIKSSRYAKENGALQSRR